MARHGTMSTFGDRAACRRFVSDVLERSGAIDVLVNNAAVLPFATLNATTDDAWDETLTVNLTAPFLLVQGFLPSMKGAWRLHY